MKVSYISVLGRIYFMLCILLLPMEVLAQFCPACPGYNINETSTAGTLASASGWTNATVTRLSSDDASVATTSITTSLLGSRTTSTLNANFTLATPVPASKSVCAIVIYINRYYSTLISLATVTDNFNVDGLTGSYANGWGTATNSSLTITASGGLTPASVNDGISFSLSVTVGALLSTGITFSVDYITATVYYSDPCPLAVELTSFIGKYNSEKNTNELFWSTESETMCDRYIVEHLNISDGVWNDIGQVAGNGTTSEQHSYSFDDYRFKKNDINYYRLSEVDTDGQLNTYDIISIDNRVMNKRIVRIVNTLGQDIDINSSGIVIIYYDDGSSEKIINK